MKKENRMNQNMVYISKIKRPNLKMLHPLPSLSMPFLHFCDRSVVKQNMFQGYTKYLMANNWITVCLNVTSTIDFKSLCFNQLEFVMIIHKLSIIGSRHQICLIQLHINKM